MSCCRSLLTPIVATTKHYHQAQPNTAFQSDGLAVAILHVRSVLGALPIYQTPLLQGRG
jgi:hypothetical protein